jgi:SSS family solute:Na+ symporter
MIAAAAWAPQIDKFPTLWQYLQSALSYIVPPIAALFFLGVFWKRANANGALAGIVMGIISATFFLGLSGSKWMPAIHFLYVAAIIFGISCLAVFAVSLLTPPPPSEKVRDFTWQRKIYDSLVELPISICFIVRPSCPDLDIVSVTCSLIFVFVLHLKLDGCSRK